MSEPIYFQWQNDILLKSIYPLRVIKLRDFLVFYHEVDLWKTYKGKTEVDLLNDRTEYKTAVSKTIVQALSDYKSLRAYFSNPVENQSTPRIISLHNIFRDNIKNIKGMRSERIFVTSRILDWEKGIKEEQQRIVRNDRRVLIFKTDQLPHNDKEILVLEAETKNIEEVILPAMKAELKHLNDYLVSIGKLEKPKDIFIKGKDDLLGKEKSLTQRLITTELRARPLEMQLQVIENEISLIKNPPKNAKELEDYFQTTNVSHFLLEEFGDIDLLLLQFINGVHARVAEILRFTSSHIEEARGIDKYIETLRNYKDTGETSRQVIAFELQRLEDFQASLRYGEIDGQDRANMLTKKDVERAEISRKLVPLTSEIADIQTNLGNIKTELLADEDERIVNDAIPQMPSLKDIVNWRVETYRNSLKDKTDNQLLEQVVDRFLAEPDRYPLWLQYMVIHFSGMRYRSAHGSWADPRDLLFNLRSYEISQKKVVIPEVLESLRDEKLRLYQPFAPSESLKRVTKPPVDGSPLLSQATEKIWIDKIKHHIKELGSPNFYKQQEALFNLSLEEENYEIQKMPLEEAMSELKKYKNDFPTDLWKEVESLTLLRLETKDEKWEDFTPDQQTERNTKAWAHYKKILTDWKAKGLTDWREDHDLTGQLIVTRAVCNEVAEHIQHIRGLSPAGGLTAKHSWYKNLFESTPASVPPEQHPFFRKARKREDFKVGASILWLRFVNDTPNQWRVAHPIPTTDGEELLPNDFLSGQATAQTGGWAYQIDKANSIKRTRNRTDRINGQVIDEEWLRWMHEATVVEAVDTAEGTVVLTFETNLPYEDKNTATIGVFKHYLSDLLYNINGNTVNGTFIGYVPESDVPAEGLEYMLDWNKILRHQRVDAAKWDEFRLKHIWKGKLNTVPEAFSVEVEPEPTITKKTVKKPSRKRRSNQWKAL